MIYTLIYAIINMIQSVKGTKDILPDTIAQWQFIEKTFKNSSDKYGYQELRSPIFEKTEVFSRSIGEATDIVNKEMYTFTDKGGESVTLRPEMTASLVRAVIQHSLIQQSSILRLWYFGPFFRYERPQKGRLRQFHQYGAECIGSPYPESDAEVIMLANEIFKAAGIKQVKFLINTLGNEDSRKKYRAALMDYFQSVKGQLSADSLNRLDFNPLRILDSKDPQDASLLQNVPAIIDYLDNESREHFEQVLALLKEQAIPYEISNRLVRGLDYYCHTVFEFQSSDLGAQDSMGGGGRYNSLFTQLGGNETPAVGFALGVERMLLVIEQNKAFPDFAVHPDMYIATTDFSMNSVAQTIAEKLRERGYNIIIDIQRRSLKAQLREANKIGAKHSVVLGEDEIKNQCVSIKNMQDGEKKDVTFSDIENLTL